MDLTLNPALAAPLAPLKPVTVAEIVAVVDELAVMSSPAPGSTIIRSGLLTELRMELRPSLGATSRGSGGARIPIDVRSMQLWEDVTARVQALPLDLDGEAPRVGSLEQIIIQWSRDVVAGDADSRARQELAGLEPSGLNQDALRLMLYRVNRIRDLIDHHFTPGKSGDIPGEACPVCGYDTVRVWDDNEGGELQMPTLGWSIRPETGLTVMCRNPSCTTTWRGRDELDILALQRKLFSQWHPTTREATDVP